MCLTILLWLVLGICVTGVCAQCTLPFTAGTWYSSTRGTWTVASTQTQIQNFEADLAASTPIADLTCVSTTGTKYLLSAQFEIFFGLYITVYTCLDIRNTTASPASYVYYTVTALDPLTGEYFTSDQSTACTNEGYETAVGTHMVLKGGSETSAAVNCPDVILGSYNVTYSTVDGVEIIGSTMNSCNDTMLMSYDNSNSGQKLGLTSGGFLRCLNYVESGSNYYVHTYNNDSTTDSSTTYKLSCWVFAYSSTGVEGTVHPRKCVSEQTATSVPYGGQTFTYEPEYTCPLNTSSTTESDNNAWVIVLIVLGVLLLLAIIAAVLYLLCRRNVAVKDEEEAIIKEERHPSPDSLNEYDVDKEKQRAQEEFNKHGKILQTDPLKDNIEREHTFDLVEVKRDKAHKLQDGQPLKTVVKDVGKTEGPREKPKPDLIPDIKVEGEKTGSDGQTGEDRPIITRPDIKVEGEKTGSDGQSGKERPIIEREETKLSIPPTQPRPDQDDQALIRIRKQREEKEKERQERLKKKQKEAEKQTKQSVRETEEGETVIKHVRESSPSDYESDDSIKEERRLKLLEKQRRLRNAAYQPPDGLTDAKVVGKKKRRKYNDDEDSDVPGALVQRRDQEQRDADRKERKKALRRLAKRKARAADNMEDSESGDEQKKTRKKKKSHSYGVEAPYTQQYQEKKGIERELDDQDYWHIKTPIGKEDSFMEVSEGTNPTKETGPVEMTSPSTLEITMQEEADVIDPRTGAPLPTALVQIGQNGNLPEGFHRDENGNVVREVDGKIITADDVAKQIELNRKLFHIFGLPRLIRNKDGRPLGGYKDDEYGPTAEWDYGEPEDEPEKDEEKKKMEIADAPQNRQVGFNVREDTNTADTPFSEDDAAGRRTRQLHSADRQLLHSRLFEQNQGSTDNVQKQPLRVFFKGERGGVKPDSVYIDNSDLTKLAKLRPPTGPRSNMITRSDTFDDARQSRAQHQAFKRNNKARSSWSASFSRNQIPEEALVETNGKTMASASNRRNLGSDDEFVLVAGSMQKLHRPPAREESLLSDISMRTAPDSVNHSDPRTLRPYFGDFYKDKKYFDQYLATEKLQTNAAVETRELASHGREFLYDRAEYWKEHDPVPHKPPPSSLGLNLSRMHTMYTIADSGMQSMRSSAADTARPHSADALPDGTGRVSKRETTRDMSFTSTPRTPLVGGTARTDPAALNNRLHSDRSERSRTNVGWLDREPKNGEGLILVRQKSDCGPKLREKSSLVDKPEPIEELREETPLPGNVLSIMDT